MSSSWFSTLGPKGIVGLSSYKLTISEFDKFGMLAHTDTSPVFSILINCALYLEFLRIALKGKEILILEISFSRLKEAKFSFRIIVSFLTFGTFVATSTKGLFPF